MTTQTSALSPLFAAIATAITSDATLAALLAGDKVYGLTAPEGAVPDYIVLASPSSASFDTFDRGGEASAITMHIWTTGPESARGLAIFGELFRVLNRKPLAVTGHAWCAGTLKMVTMMPDPGGEMAHTVVMYRPTTLPT